MLREEAIAILLFTFYGRFRCLHAVHIHAYVCALCWPEPPCVEVRAHIRVSSSDTFHFTFETWSLDEPVSSLLFQLDWLTREPPESVRLYLPPHQVYGGWCPSQHFYTGSRDRNSGSHAWIASPFFTKPLPQTLCDRKAAQLPLCSHPMQVNEHKTFQAVVCEQKSICQWLEHARRNSSLWAWQTCSPGSPEIETGRLLLHLGFIWRVRLCLYKTKDKGEEEKKNPKVLSSHLLASEGLESSCVYLSEQHFHVFMQ